jgi:uncharacterized protein
LEHFATDPKLAAELARLANDEMAELIATYPERFVGAIALLPMNEVDAALVELDRAIQELRFKAAYVHSNIDGKALGLAGVPTALREARRLRPAALHPSVADDDFQDYATETTSKYAIASTFGWPYETTAAMTRTVLSGLFERFPGLKVVAPAWSRCTSRGSSSTTARGSRDTTTTTRTCAS